MHWCTRDKHRDSRLHFRSHLRQVHLCWHLHWGGRIDLSLNIRWAWKVVLRFGIRRKMWDLHWRTRDKHRDSQLLFRRHLRWVHLCRHLHRRGRIDLSLDIRWALKIVLRLDIRRPSGDILGLDISRAWRVQVALGLEIR